MRVAGIGTINVDYGLRYLRCRKCGRTFTAFPGTGKALHGLCHRCYRHGCEAMKKS